MDAATSLDDAVRTAQDIMWAALSPGSARAAAVVKLRDLLWSTKMTRALAISSDNCLAFALRQSRIALADTAGQDSVGIVDDPRQSRSQRRPRDSASDGRGATKSSVALARVVADDNNRRSHNVA